MNNDVGNVSVSLQGKHSNLPLAKLEFIVPKQVLLTNPSNRRRRTRGDTRHKIYSNLIKSSIYILYLRNNRPTSFLASRLSMAAFSGIVNSLMSMLVSFH